MTVIATPWSILIVGGGSWGCSTALALARRGYTNVTVLEAHPIPSPISAGNDVNKIVSEGEYDELKDKEVEGDDRSACMKTLRAKAAYGWNHDPVYSPYYHNTGYIVCASTPRGIEHMMSREVGTNPEELGYKRLESPEDFRQSFPEGILNGEFKGWKGFYKPKGAGWAHARKTIVSMYKEAERLGVKFVTGGEEGRVVSLVEEDGDIRGARTADGKEHRADRTILSAGATAPQLVDMENQIRSTAWTLGHIQMTPEETKAYKDLPVLFHLEQGFFIEPDEDAHQLKICDEHPGYCNWVTKPGAEFPTSVPFAKQQIPVQSERRIHELLRTTMPQLADRPLVHARLCWCADTRDRTFIITYHPSHPSLVIASGDTGSGFSSVPAIGQFIVDCMEGTLEPRFARLWRWRPEIAQGFWGEELLDRTGADWKVIDLQKAAAEGWTHIGEN